MQKIYYLIIPTVVVLLPIFIGVLATGIVSRKEYINSVLVDCKYMGYRIVRKNCYCHRQNSYCPVLKEFNNHTLLDQCQCTSGIYTAYMRFRYMDSNKVVHTNTDKYTCGKNITILKQVMANIPTNITCWYDKDDPNKFDLGINRPSNGLVYIITAVIMFALLISLVFTWVYKYGRKVCKTKDEYRQIPTIANSSMNFYN